MRHREVPSLPPSFAKNFADLTETEKDERLKYSNYVSFDDNAEANAFRVNIANYSEVDWFDFESRMRRLMHQLMDPLIILQNDDRARTHRLKNTVDA